MGTYKLQLATAVNLYPEANAETTPLTLIDAGTEIVVSDCNGDNGWYCTTYNGNSGYIVKNASMTTEPMPKVECYVNSTGLNFRVKPSTSASTHGQLRNETFVKVQKHDDVWSSLTHNGNFGFVMTKFLINPEADVTSVTKEEFYAEVTDSNGLNLRLGPGTKYGIFYKLPRNRIVVCEGIINDKWYKTRYMGGPAYIDKNYMTKGTNAKYVEYVARCVMIARNEAIAGRSDPTCYENAEGKWCQLFVNWLLRASLMPAERVPTTSGTGYAIEFWVNEQQKHGGKFYFKSQEHKRRLNRASDYDLNVGDTLTAEEIAFVPQPGDVIYLRWSGKPESVNVSHVGFVTAVDETDVYTIEGNAGSPSKVRECTYSRIDEQIIGYARPNYSKN